MVSRAVFGRALLFEDGCFHLDLLNDKFKPRVIVDTAENPVVGCFVIDDGVASHRDDLIAESLRISDGALEVTGGNQELNWHLVDGVNARSDKWANQRVSCLEVWNVLLEAAHCSKLPPVLLSFKRVIGRAIIVSAHFGAGYRVWRFVANNSGDLDKFFTPPSVQALLLEDRKDSLVDFVTPSLLPQAWS